MNKAIGIVIIIIWIVLAVWALYLVQPQFKIEPKEKYHKTYGCYALGKFSSASQVAMVWNDSGVFEFSFDYALMGYSQIRI